MNQSITLKIPKQLSDSDWHKISEIYRSMDGWLDGQDFPYWYGTQNNKRFITVSFEPSGLVFTGNVDDDLWTGWLTQLCARLSIALGAEVCDATF